MNFNICILKPDDKISPLAYWETAELIHYSLMELGHQSLMGMNRIDIDAKNIVFGYAWLKNDFIGRLTVPDNTAFFNTEPVYDENLYEKREKLFEIIKKYEVWDYSPINVNYLLESGFKNVKLLQFGYQPELNRIPKPDTQDIDVLFYGSLNDRRAGIINELVKKGLTVKNISGIYQEERDQYIARSKLILNIYYYNTQTFDVIRNFYLMSNAKAVVTEADENFPVPVEYRAGICGVAYQDIVEACINLINNDSLRFDLERNALTVMQALPQTLYTQRLI